jgi:hypothetical protein
MERIVSSSCCATWVNKDLVLESSTRLADVVKKPARANTPTTMTTPATRTSIRVNPESRPDFRRDPMHSDMRFLTLVVFISDLRPSAAK